jgi:hypothetical protein
MFFSGTIRFHKPNFAFSSASLMDALENHAYDVKQEGKQITMLVPGPDSLLLDAMKSASIPVDWAPWESFARLLWDQLSFTVKPDGSIDYTLKYWTLPQLIFHAFINLLIAIEFIFASQHLNAHQMLAVVLFGNALPILGSHFNIYLFLQKIERSLQET